MSKKTESTGKVIIWTVFIIISFTLILRNPDRFGAFIKSSPNLEPTTQPDYQPIRADFSKIFPTATPTPTVTPTLQPPTIKYQQPNPDQQNYELYIQPHLSPETLHTSGRYLIDDYGNYYYKSGYYWYGSNGENFRQTETGLSGDNGTNCRQSGNYYYCD